MTTFRQQFCKIFPISATDLADDTRKITLEYVRTRDEEHGRVPSSDPAADGPEYEPIGAVVLRLVRWRLLSPRAPNEIWTIDDVIEQELQYLVFFQHTSEHSHLRRDSFLCALRDEVGSTLGRIPSDRIVFPAELLSRAVILAIDLRSVPDDGRDKFHTALRTKGRLGRWSSC